MSTDLIKNVFGSDSDDSDSDDDQGREARETADDPSEADGNDELGEEGRRKKKKRRAQIADDSEDEEGEEEAGEGDGAGAEAAAPKFRSSLEDPELASDDDEDADVDDRGAGKMPTGPPLQIVAPLYDPLKLGVTAKLVKMSNVVGVESRPFDPETYELEESHVVNADGTMRMRASDTNVIRWRTVKNPDGSTKTESNARFVKWSDGSVQLLLGDEVLSVSEQPMQGHNSYLYVRHQGLIQAQAHVASKLVFKPTNLDSRTHLRLTRAIDTKHVKTKKTQKFIAVVDPEREKEEMDREAERVNKEQELLARKQSQAMGRGGYGAGGSRSAREAYYDAGYAMDGDFLENDEDDEEEGGVAAAARARMTGRKSAGKEDEYEKDFVVDGSDDDVEEEEVQYDDEEAMDEEEEEIATKVPKKKRGRALESDSDD